MICCKNCTVWPKKCYWKFLEDERENQVPNSLRLLQDLQWNHWKIMWQHKILFVASGLLPISKMLCFPAASSPWRMEQSRSCLMSSANGTGCEGLCKPWVLSCIPCISFFSFLSLFLKVHSCNSNASEGGGLNNMF